VAGFEGPGSGLGHESREECPHIRRPEGVVKRLATTGGPPWSLATIYRGMEDFMVIQVIALLMVILFPEIALWFPRWLFWD
jgi:hypothetical protein